MADLRAAVADLQQRVAMLEQGRQTPSGGDVELFRVVTERTAGEWVTADALIQRATVDEELRAALNDRLIEDAIELGMWLRAMRGVQVGGFRLQRGARTGQGFRWRVQVCT